MAIQYSASFLFRSKHQFKLTSPKRVHKHFEEISKDNQDRYKENYPPPSPLNRKTAPYPNPNSNPKAGESLLGSIIKTLALNARH